MNPALTKTVQAELIDAPPDPIRVGAGTAFYLRGRLDAADHTVDRVRLRVGDVGRDVDAHSMPPERSYGAGGFWWSMVEIDGPVEPGPVPVVLTVTVAGTSIEIALGELELARGGEGLSDPIPAPDPPAPSGPGDQPLIAICMATYDPSPERLARQLDSIRAQTWDNWICAISDDRSPPDAHAELQRQTAGDPRFVLSDAPERLGFLRNFERAMSLAPESAELISLADQDDRWDSDKLEVLATALGSNPGSKLVYSDVRIAGPDGTILSDTYWFERDNSYDSMVAMMIANNVTGPAAMFRRELLETALPLPPSGTGQEVYHDHWLALCALASSPLTYVDRPTHDYTRHEDSVTLREADGEWSKPPQGRGEQLQMRWRRFARRLRVASRSPGWRAVYVGRYLLIRQLATILEMRLGRAAIDPRHLRDLDRLLAAESSPRAAAWLLARSFRPWIGRNETLARERAVFGGILWRHLVGGR